MSTQTVLSDHSFHIPVMGTAFTIDTPLKVGRFGVSSVVSLCDDELCENMREHYSTIYGLSFTPILKNDHDCRAKRITAYLNMLDRCVKQQVVIMKKESFDKETDLVKYFDLLPEQSATKILYKTMLKTHDEDEKLKLQGFLRECVVPGFIDVNIMTKLDRDTYDKSGNKQDQIYSDALSALRGYALSDLDSSIVFSAGFNRRLYAYIENFSDFFPDETGYIKKKVVLKVSDFRSSLTQGRFLAKKGIWVSEYRIESGLNCGGHAFATDGLLLGPILEEFKQQRSDLVSTLLATCNAALTAKGKFTFAQLPSVFITVQGGIGTANENSFLLDYYQLQRTGWATPFLLVKEASLIDEPTRQLLADAGEKDLYLSKNSPLGVPFNTVKDTDSEKQKLERYAKGRPGSPCPKGYLVSNTEFSKKPVCTASIFFQKRKIEQLKSLSLSNEDLDKAIQDVIVKSCLCEDLAAGALIDNEITNKRSLTTAVCPGPNLRYFSKFFSLKDMIGHIYGRVNVLNDKYRPNLFVSELMMYMKYFREEIIKLNVSPSQLDIKYLQTFYTNLFEGIDYYNALVPKLAKETSKYKDKMKEELQEISNELNELIETYSNILTPIVPALS